MITGVPNKTMAEQLICDRCKVVIHTEGRYGGDDTLTDLMERMYKVAHRHRDQNRGHECDKCRQKRHDAYDDYVTAEGCSCHINPPCSYCVNKDDEI